MLAFRTYIELVPVYEHSPLAIQESDCDTNMLSTLSIHSLPRLYWHHVSTIKFAWVHWIEKALPCTWHTGGIPKTTTTRTKQWTAFQNLNCISEPNFLDRSKKILRVKHNSSDTRTDKWGSTTFHICCPEL